MTVPRALTIAGSDPSGGAGIAQDLRTFHAFGVWGMAAITAVTVQDTTGVKGWHGVPPEEVRAQIDVVVSDVGVDAVKTGMVPDARTMYEIGRALDRHSVAHVVVDPILTASSGDVLGESGLVFAFRELLLPRAFLVTPNVDEAYALTGIEIRDRATQIDAARALVGLGARNALVTGGHLDATDVLVADDGEVRLFEGARIDTADNHGTGCVLSAAITAGLACGRELEDAVAAGKHFVTRALERGLRIGRGRGPVSPPQTA